MSASNEAWNHFIHSPNTFFLDVYSEVDDGDTVMNKIEHLLYKL